MNDELDALASEFVLGTLPQEERDWVRQRIAHDLELRDAIDRWERRLHPLTTMASPQPPSPGLWGRITASLEWHPQPDPDESRASQPRVAWLQRLGWNSLPVWRGLSAAGALSAAVLAAVLFVRPLPTEYVVVLVTPDSTHPGWVVQSVGADTLELIPLAPFALPADQALEFWTKADAWSAPVSLGLVEPGRSLRIALDDLPPLEPNQLFELTLEPATGSPIGLPTGPIQAIGRAVRMQGA